MKPNSASTLSFLLLSLASMSGCSSSQPLDDGAAGHGGDADGAAGEDDGAAGRSAIPAKCEAPGYGSDDAPVTIDQVTALVRDGKGKAVENLAVQVCGLDVCLNGMTNASGKASVAPGVALTRPAFKYGDGFEFGKLAVLLGDDRRQDLGSLVAVRLPAYDAGSAFQSPGDTTNGDVTLTIASHTQISHDILTYSDESQLTFRSAPIPIAESARALDPSLGFELAFALAPVSTTFCPAAAVSIDNRLAWAANTEVEIFIQGLEVDEEFAPYGSWVKVGEGRVGRDEKRIETTSGGIPILSSIALRRKP